MSRNRILGTVTVGVRGGLRPGQVPPARAGALPPGCGCPDATL